jgi:hypothetical protein
MAYGSASKAFLVQLDKVVTQLPNANGRVTDVVGVVCVGFDLRTEAVLMNTIHKQLDGIELRPVSSPT